MLLVVVAELDPVFADAAAPLLWSLVFELAVDELVLLLGLVVELTVLAVWALLGLLLGWAIYVTSAMAASSSTSAVDLNAGCPAILCNVLLDDAVRAIGI